MKGQTISHYRIGDELGRGGMGVVYMAEDTRLGRTVALKFLPSDLTHDEEAKTRFTQEARAASALDHPNICTIYEIDESADGQIFIAMPYYQGETLKKRIEHGPISADAALDIAAQIARGLAGAHEAGIVHRDIKPANLMITKDGLVKILDFGVAKLSGLTGVTRTGVTVGTVAYMSPEQLSGAGADQSFDLWALGVVLYQMLAGRLPYRSDNEPVMLNAVLNGTLTPLRDAVPTVPARVEQIVTRALQEDRKARYATAAELRRDLEDSRAALTTPTHAVAASPRRLGPARVLLSAAAVLLVLAGAAWWIWNSGADVRWARNVAIPQIEQYVDASDWEAAYALAKQVQARVPDEPALAELWPRFSWVTTIPSDPAGARVYRRPYSAKGDDWEELGTTPLEKIRLPFGLSMLRVELEGHHSMLRALGGGVLVSTELPVSDSPSGEFVVAPDVFKLDTDESAPPGMVRVPGWRGAELGEPIRFADSFLARHEVTNREYKTFVAAGGYERQDLWEHPFIRDGRAISWSEAMRLLKDRTNRPGPSTWEAGTYPDGQDDYPVGGVSWYEAAAYARFVGQELPTVHHWRHAFAPGLLSWMLPASNVERDGPAPVGQFQGVSWPGTFDMAGNVREWCFNATGDRRFILGSGWNDSNQVAADRGYSQLPFDRSEINGFRLAVTHEDTTVLARMRRPLSEGPALDIAGRKPVSDDVFRAYHSMYAYDPAPLKATIEASETKREWIRERISFDAAYGGQRMVLYLYLPRTGSPPFQTVLYWPGAAAQIYTSIDQYPVHLDFILKSGRAVGFPVYQETFERGGGKGARYIDGSAASRAILIQWVNDLRRSVDYLETRTDIDARAFSFYGHSWGGSAQPGRSGCRATDARGSSLRRDLASDSTFAGSRSVDVPPKGPHPRTHAQRRARQHCPSRVGHALLHAAGNGGCGQEERGGTRRPFRTPSRPHPRDAGLARQVPRSGSPLNNVAPTVRVRFIMERAEDAQEVADAMIAGLL